MKDDLQKNTENKVENAAAAVIEPQSEEHEEIIAFLKNVKFRRKMIGGLDARSVWKKLEELNRLYDAAIRAEKIRGKALLDEYKRAAANEMKMETMETATATECSDDVDTAACPDAAPPTGGNDEED